MQRKEEGTVEAYGRANWASGARSTKGDSTARIAIDASRSSEARRAIGDRSARLEKEARSMMRKREKREKPEGEYLSHDATTKRFGKSFKRKVSRTAIILPLKLRQN